MNTLLVTLYFAPELGAAPSRLTNMAEGLVAMGDHVDVLTALPNYPKGRIFDGYRHCFFRRERRGGCEVFRYWTLATLSKNPAVRGFSLIAFSMVLWAFALRWRRIRGYDRIVVQSPPLPVAGSAMLLFKGVYGKRVFLNVSDLWPLSAVELGAMREGSSIHRIFSKIERFIYRKADGILGQSEEILEHVSAFPSSGRRFLYRNLQRYDCPMTERERNPVVKIVYAGLLGVAQDVLGIVRHIDFRALGCEFHIYGGGNQREAIEQYIAEHESCNVVYHGFIAKERIAGELRQYDASVIPLAVRIRGAVPSKIFDILPMGMPVLFCGGGEGAKIVATRGVGFVSAPGDYTALGNNIRKLTDMPDEAYRTMTRRCIDVCRREFDFDRQMRACHKFIETTK